MSIEKDLRRIDSISHGVYRFKTEETAEGSHKSGEVDPGKLNLDGNENEFVTFLLALKRSEFKSKKFLKKMFQNYPKRIASLKEKYPQFQIEFEMLIEKVLGE